MISSLRGKVIACEPDYAVIECGGVGFKCFISLNTAGQLPKIGSDAFLYTFLSVKEDALDLYGFCTPEEMECFKLITSVNGVGPKIGIALLSQFTADKLLLCIAGSDAKALTSASGVGIKLAQRIILELKDKVGKIGISSSEVVAAENASSFTDTREAVSALVALGFSQSDAAVAVGKQDPGLPTQVLIKNALKELSRQV